MNKRAVEQYIKNHNLFKKFEVKKLGKGNNSNVFVVKVGKQKYTFRVGKQGFVSQNRYKEHHLALKFLEYSKISFVPKSIYFDPREEVLITTYAPGKPITDTGLNSKQLKLLVKQLVELNSLKYDDYLKFLKKEKIKPVNVVTPLQSIRQYGVKKYNILKKICLDKEILAWLKPELKRNVACIMGKRWDKKDLIFTHGDLTGANIVASKNELYFIDWEQARFVYNMSYGLSYLFIHFEFFAFKQEKIIKLYAHYSKVNVKRIKETVMMSMKIIKVNDIIWSATMYSELYKGKKRGWKKYYKMTQQRMKEFEKLI